MKTKIYFLIYLAALLMLSNIILAQGVAINDDDSEADPSAMLDIKSTDGGLLIPRLTITQRDAINTPANGLLVYVTDDNSFYYFDGGSWNNVSESAETPVEAWQTPTLLNGITNYGIDYNDAGFYKDRNRVYLRGLVSNVGYNTTIFVLPVGYRPTASTAVNTIGNEQHKRVQITTDGSVSLLSSNSGWLSLENISFRVD